MTDTLAGKRILVVEDEFLVADFIEDVLTDMGATVVGPAARVEEGADLARDEQLDAAILDVNLNDRRSDPIAEILKSRGVPYLLATGYGETGETSDAPILTKPFAVEKLAHAVSALVNGSQSDH